MGQLDFLPVLLGSDAVSYTHLDVYKSQIQESIEKGYLEE